MSILTRQDLVARLTSTDEAERIVLTPLVNAEVGAGSLDVRLGRHFIAFRKTRFMGIEVLGTLRKALEDAKRSGAAVSESELDLEVAKRVERIYVPIGEEFVLHPQQLVLACTVEYLVLPRDLGAYVLSRSSTGRLGILSATATFFHPGFKGVPTLELINTGDTAVTVAPGMRIAQFVFEETRGPAAKNPGRYQLSTRPGISMLSQDPDIRRLAEMTLRDL